MEIIKPGKIRKIKLKCDECGCEFTCHLGELIHRYGSVWAQCPQEGCHKSVEVPNGTPEYIAPAKLHNAVGTVAVDLPMVIVTEAPVENGRYLTRVDNIAGATANILKALGGPITLTIDGGSPERFYIGSGGTLIAYTPHTGKLYKQE